MSATVTNSVIVVSTKFVEKKNMAQVEGSKVKEEARFGCRKSCLK
jgi:hypothetical protein